MSESTLYKWRVYTDVGFMDGRSTENLIQAKNQLYEAMCLIDGKRGDVLRKEPGGKWEIVK